MRYLILTPLLFLLLLTGCGEENSLLIEEIPTPQEPVVTIEDSEFSFRMETTRRSEARLSRGVVWEYVPGNWIISSDSVFCNPVNGATILIESDTFFLIDFLVAANGDLSLFPGTPVMADFSQPDSTNISAMPLGDIPGGCPADDLTFTADFSTPGFVSGELITRLYNTTLVLDLLSQGSTCDELDDADLGVFTLSYNVPIVVPCE